MIRKVTAGPKARESPAWIVADQILSTLTNFALISVVARSTSPSTFGRFALIQALYTVVVGGLTTLSTDPLIVRHAGSRRLRLLQGDAISLTVLLSIAIALATIFVAIVLGFRGPAWGAPLLALGLCLPGLALHEACRQILASSNRALQAFWWDVSWTILEAGGLGYVLVENAHPAVWVFVAIWGSSGGISAIGSAVFMGSPLGLKRGIRHLRATQDLGLPFVGDFMASSGSAQVVLFIVGALVGLAGAGALRALQALFGPLGVVYSASRLFLLPRVRRFLRNWDVFSGYVQALALCLQFSLFR